MTSCREIRAGREDEWLIRRTAAPELTLRSYSDRSLYRSRDRKRGSPPRAGTCRRTNRTTASARRVGTSGRLHLPGTRNMGPAPSGSRRSRKARSGSWRPGRFSSATGPLPESPSGELAAELCAMKGNQVGHTGDLEIGPSRIAARRRNRCRAPAADILAAIDPQRGEPDRFRRQDVVEEALRHMEDPVLGDTQRLVEIGQCIVEVPQARLVAADILGRDDPIEFDAEFPIAARSE